MTKKKQKLKNWENLPRERMDDSERKTNGRKRRKNAEKGERIDEKRKRNAEKKKQK